MKCCSPRKEGGRRKNGTEGKKVEGRGWGVGGEGKGKLRERKCIEVHMVLDDA